MFATQNNTKTASIQIHLVFVLSVPTIENSTDVLKYVQSSIAVPPSEIPEGDVGIVQTSYSTPILFQLQPNEDSNDNITVDTEVIGLSFVNGKLENTSEPVEITLQSTRMRQGMV